MSGRWTDWGLTEIRKRIVSQREWQCRVDALVAEINALYAERDELRATLGRIGLVNARADGAFEEA